MVSNGYLLIAMIVMTAATQLTRLTPFVLWSKKKPPRMITYLGKVLGTGIIAMLVVYSFKDTVVLSWPYGIPQAITIVVVLLLHKWKHNMMISIFGGTALYMFLIQTVFA